MFMEVPIWTAILILWWEQDQSTLELRSRQNEEGLSLVIMALRSAEVRGYEVIKKVMRVIRETTASVDLGIPRDLSLQSGPRKGDMGNLKPASAGFKRAVGWETAVSLLSRDISRASAQHRFSTGVAVPEVLMQCELVQHMKIDINTSVLVSRT